MVYEADPSCYYRDPSQLQLYNPDCHVVALHEDVGLVNVTLAQDSKLFHPYPHLAHKGSEDACLLVS